MSVMGMSVPSRAHCTFELLEPRIMLSADPNFATLAEASWQPRVAYDTTELLDFGDAPDPSYPTLLRNNGAGHAIQTVPGSGLLICMGIDVDAEPDSQPNAWADGDDLANRPDEDGVFFVSAIVPGQWADVDVEVTVDGYIDAWVDFHADGDWNGIDDQIFFMEPVYAGVNALSFSVPADAATYVDTYSRFRFTTDGGYPYDGLAPDGEVEDHLVWIEEGGEGLIKWDQPPVEATIYDGWNEPSIHEGPQIAADDWFCATDAPVTEIVWWGSFLAQVRLAAKPRISGEGLPDIA